jgi:hypothetical protein
MHHRFASVFSQRGRQQIAVANVSFHQRWGHPGYALDPAGDIASGVCEVVEDDDAMTRLDQSDRSVRAYKAGTAGNQNCHRFKLRQIAPKLQLTERGLGTKPTSCDVRGLVAIRGEADIARIAQFGRE